MNFVGEVIGEGKKGMDIPGKVSLKGLMGRQGGDLMMVSGIVGTTS